jgi:hypothetical protein
MSDTLKQSSNQTPTFSILTKQFRINISPNTLVQGGGEVVTEMFDLSPKRQPASTIEEERPSREVVGGNYVG